MANPKIEELPDDFDEKTDLNKQPASQPPPPPPPLDGMPAGSLESMLSQMPAFPPKEHDAPPSGDPSQPGAAMPPAMESVKQHTADEVLAMMNRVPLFMTSLDETDGEEGENMALEAIKALAYEGTRAEIAGNFREQGNEMARAKQWVDAREYYTKAIGAMKMPRKPQDKEEGPSDMEVVEVDEEEESRKEKEIEEASYTNRALCNLEMSINAPS